MNGASDRFRISQKTWQIILQFNWQKNGYGIFCDACLKQVAILDRKNGQILFVLCNKGGEKHQGDYEDISDRAKMT